MSLWPGCSSSPFKSSAARRTCRAHSAEGSNGSVHSSIGPVTYFLTCPWSPHARAGTAESSFSLHAAGKSPPYASVSSSVSTVLVHSWPGWT
eukprot:scaffold638_cov382-Prasinococcus_capsulatus_cf.AAC.14